MIRVLFNVIMMLVGLAAGWLGARYMMETATASSATSNGGWQEIRLGGDGLLPTYQTAHFLWRGQVPPPLNVRIYRRSTDDEGQTLHGDCTVTVEGDLPTARWWFLSAADQAKPAALSAGEIVREPNNSMIVTLSKYPMPGNWLAVENGDYSLRLVIEDIADGQQPRKLPSVKRLWC